MGDTVRALIGHNNLLLSFYVWLPILSRYILLKDYGIILFL